MSDFLDFLSSLVNGAGDSASGPGTAVSDLANTGYSQDILGSLLGGLMSGDSTSDNAAFPVSPPYSYDPSQFGGSSAAGAAPSAYNFASALTTPKSSSPSFMDQAGGWLSRMMKGDKDTLSQARMGLGALGMLSSLVQSRKARNSLSPGQLQAMLSSKYGNWTPSQQQAFNNYFYQPLPALKPLPQPSPLKLAAGGPACACGAPPAFSSGGAGPLVQGSAPGQSDKVDAKLSPGEYVMDADIVSALGDGNNAAGAAALDDMREAVRRHKRAAPAHKIPPAAKSPLQYLKESKHGA